MIEIWTSFFPLAWVLYLCTPQVSIDGGAPFKVRWKTPVPVPVGPGRHKVEVWVPYLILPRMGRQEVWVDLPAGSGVRVEWKPTWWFAFLPGQIRLSAATLPLAAAEAAAQQQAAYQQQAIAQQQAAVQYQQQHPQQAAVAAQPQAAAAPAGGWHPDPSGRHAQRWWDGSQWTSHVTDGGQPFVDPLGAAS